MKYEHILVTVHYAFVSRVLFIVMELLTRRHCVCSNRPSCFWPILLIG